MDRCSNSGESSQRRETDRRERVNRRCAKRSKSRETLCFFQCFVALQGRTVGSQKRQVRSHRVRWGMNNCTPSRHEADFKVNSLFWLFCLFLFSDCSNHCCWICPYVGSLTSKLPSMISSDIQCLSYFNIHQLLLVMIHTMIPMMYYLCTSMVDCASISSTKCPKRRAVTSCVRKGRPRDAGDCFDHEAWL